MFSNKFGRIECSINLGYGGEGVTKYQYFLTNRHREFKYIQKWSTWVMNCPFTQKKDKKMFKFQFSDNFYLVTVTEKIVMWQENSKGDKNCCIFNRHGIGTKRYCQCHRYLLLWQNHFSPVADWPRTGCLDKGDVIGGSSLCFTLLSLFVVATTRPHLSAPCLALYWRRKVEHKR